MSTGTLPLIPADIFFAKQKLTRELKREPTDEELANKVEISLKDLNDRLNMKTAYTKYTENSLSPSYQNRAHDYYASSIQKKMPIFENPNRYDDIGGGKKSTRQYKNRKYTKKYKKSKSRRESMKKSIKKGMKKYI